ncbi:hypothetical protein [Hymenobacter sp. 102]|uniref:hypothetical protein n=1 Tax=Hymenobacter sp. 102 TaxID=3403152 RepID=UPI003CF0BE70
MKTPRFIPLLLLLGGCLSLQSEEQKAEAAEKAVLARHDELMAQMDHLYDLRQQLQKIPGTDTAAAGRQRRALLGAENAMMFWMHHYRKPADTMAVEGRLAYFDAQQQRIDSVASLFRTSQDSARLVLAAGSSAPSSAQ